MDDDELVGSTQNLKVWQKKKELYCTPTFFITVLQREVYTQPWLVIIIETMQ